VINHFSKYLTALSTPAFWPALVRGVMPAVEHIDALKRLKPKTLIDVGANKGQFSLIARHLFPEIQIHAFEPLEGERELYKAVVSEPVEVHSTALSDVTGDAKFFITSRSDSSSLLRPGANQQTAYGVVQSSEGTVPVARLDEFFHPWNLARPTLLKLDVQGAELRVLRGAERVLSLIDAVYCEVSFVELYEDQPRADEIVAFLARADFTLRGAFNLSCTSKFGPTQSDFLFLAKDRV
jgi:FkbM family methyltransferase